MTLRRDKVISVLAAASLLAAGWAIFRRGVTGTVLEVIERARSYASARPSYPPPLLEALNSSNSRGRLSRVHEMAERAPSRSAVLVFFSSACTGCSTGALVDLLNDRAARDKAVAYVALVPNTFNEADMRNFQTNLNLSFPVEVADPELTQEWLALNREYGEASVNGVVAVVGGGRILSAARGYREAESLIESVPR
ncbi:MAG: hypothetical protein M3416_02440 [Acidobacteriota bacterium]|nr:hypothetical protein [Acidobacteriota bacterium]